MPVEFAPHAQVDLESVSAPASDVALAVRGLGKCYRIYRRPQDRLKQAIFRGRKRYFREFWALHDVSLEVRRGETVGIMGRNGCGKSTLLQLICNTLRPTTGRIDVRGRIAALLELGAGFNPEFSGRDNVYTAAAILGLSREETDRRYDDIVDFAELADFIDQPVKTYSSGMYVRLAFAVAISVEPDILVIDEALSVGDEAFQRKCFARIQAIQERGGTILFVSHSAGSILDLCNRAVLLDRGELLLEGPPPAVVNRYHKLLYAPADKAEAIREEIIRSSPTTGSPPPAAIETTPAPACSGREAVESGQAYFEPNLKPSSTVVYPTRGAEILDPHVTTPSGRRVNMLMPHEDYVIRFRVRFSQPAYRVVYGSMIKTLQGAEISGLASLDRPMDRVSAATEVHVALWFRCMLRPGVYFANTGVFGAVQGHEGFLHRMADVLMFRVMNQPHRSTTGVVDLFLDAEIRSRDLSTEEAA